MFCLTEAAAWPCQRSPISSGVAETLPALVRTCADSSSSCAATARMRRSTSSVKWSLTATGPPACRCVRPPVARLQDDAGPGVAVERLEVDREVRCPRSGPPRSSRRRRRRSTTGTSTRRSRSSRPARRTSVMPQQCCWGAGVAETPRRGRRTAADGLPPSTRPGRCRLAAGLPTRTHGHTHRANGASCSPDGAGRHTGAPVRRADEDGVERCG